MLNSDTLLKRVAAFFVVGHVLVSFLLVFPTWTEGKTHHQRSIFVRDYRTEFDDDFNELLGSSDYHQTGARLRRIPRAAVAGVDRSEGGLGAVQRRITPRNGLNWVHYIMQTPALIRAQGYPSEVHKVVTEDGYILELHRIPGPRKEDQIILTERSSMRRQKNKFNKRATEEPSGAIESVENRRRSGKYNETKRSLTPNPYDTNLDIREEHSPDVFYGSGDKKEEYSFDSLTSGLGEFFLVHNTATNSSNKMKRACHEDSLLFLRSLPIPFRGFFNEILPLINQSQVSFNQQYHGTRIIKSKDPSPVRGEGRSFENTSFSLDLSMSQDLQEPLFFVESIGDSGASGKPVVLLMHGLLADSSGFVWHDAHEALPYLLADAGYDVWMANWRGNSYSRGHVRLDPDHADFWNFSLDEIARYDIPAIFDYILNKTRQQNLHYVGQSYGNFVLWAALNHNPSLNSKVRLMVSVGGGWGFNDLHEQTWPKALSLYVDKNYRSLEGLGIHELFVPNKLRSKLANTACGPQSPLRSICSALYEKSGMPVDPKYMGVALAQFPSGTSSLRLLVQFVQMSVAGDMLMFNFGWKENLRRYGQLSPPKYLFSSVTCPVALLSSRGDIFATQKTIDRIARLLPNVVQRTIIDDPNFSHFQYFVGKKSKELVYIPILNWIQQF